jgi:hypothetical protein
MGSRTDDEYWNQKYDEECICQTFGLGDDEKSCDWCGRTREELEQDG